MCLVTKPVGSGSSAVISSSLLLWSTLGGKWQGICCVRKLGDITFSVCPYIVVQMDITYIQPRYCTSLFYLPTRHCGVSDMGLDYLWAYNSSVKVAEINESFFSGWEALTALFYGCTCCLSLMLLTPGYTSLSYTLPGQRLSPAWLQHKLSAFIIPKDLHWQWDGTVWIIYGRHLRCILQRCEYHWNVLIFLLHLTHCVVSPRSLPHCPECS